MKGKGNIELTCLSFSLSFSLSLSFSFFFSCLFRAIPTAYGGSLARGPIRAAASGLRQSHSNVRSEPCLHLHHSSWQCWILNPLGEDRDQTRILMVPSRVR